jgi:hypothetical protein
LEFDGAGIKGREEGFGEGELGHGVGWRIYCTFEYMSISGLVDDG